MIAQTQTASQTQLDQLCINTIRTLSMDAVQQANSGHPGTPMALALQMTLIFSNGTTSQWKLGQRTVQALRELSALPQSLPTASQDP